MMKMIVEVMMMMMTMMMMMMMMMMIMMIMMMIMMMVEGLKWAFKGSKTEILTSKKRLKDGNGDFILRGLFSRNWGNFLRDSQMLILFKRKFIEIKF